MELNGYYAGLVRSQLAQDEIETKEELEIEKKKSSLKRRNTDEEVQFHRKDSEIYIEEDTVKVNPCRVLKEVTHDHCCVLILALIGAAGVGFAQPINGLIMAHAMNGLNCKSRFFCKKVKNDINNKNVYMIKPKSLMRTDTSGI